jgi:NitT/TauT family transport system substrate-binding protein
MQMETNRRHVLATLSSAAATLIGETAFAQEPPPEVTTIRLTKTPGICVAPQYVAEALLKIEGFRDIQYVEVPLDVVHRSAGTDKIDINMGFIASFVAELDLDAPITLLGGVHAGCFELFGTKRVSAIRDLKGKTVAVPALGSAHHLFTASMAAHVGLDAKRELNFVTYPVDESQLIAKEKVDALMGFPPVPQELREKKIGHVIVDSRLDRPWSQYFCCMVAANREFARKHPVACEASAARDFEGDELLCRRTGAGRPPSSRAGLPIQLRASNNERDSLRAMAGLRCRRYGSVLCATSARSGYD